MRFIPPTTNEHYRGALWASLILGLVALYKIGGGLAQIALPDSGLISLAGLNLAHEGGLHMIAMAAQAGATQFIWGLALGLVALRHRNLTALFLILAALENALIIIGILIKPTNAAMQLPGSDAALLLFGLCLLAIFGARPKSA
jgi:hypothetical protein